MNPVWIEGKMIDSSAPVYTVAELSGNHGGSLDRALRMIDAAKEAGADAVKIQVYRPDTITLNCDKPDFLIPANNAWSAYRTLYELYQHAHTPWEWIPALFDRAHEKDISIFGSVFDETAVDLLEKQQVPAYKIAAPEIRDIPLLKKVAATGKPVFLSSGISTLDELARAVRIVRETGGQPIIMKCSTAYPTPPQEVNLKTIPNLIEIFDCPVGLSDHTLGMGASIGAVALGAMVIEKHVKLPDEEDTVDSFFSLKIEEFAHLVREIKTAQSSLGAVNYEITPEVSKNRNGHRSLYVCAPIKAGEIFSAKNIKSVRPGFGLDTAYYDLVLGRKAARDLAAGDRLAWDLIS